ncbi:hypothetical protein PIB30_052176 [Stylosanthes scabra]|uniref:C2H2-type domain-containing protein n=1 Tax=Stylosanthes scabra TaxID=79078 RepID=A0ABU6SIN6_9FABA|nr:hypothetical protein [Stylosanthes scabra]
MGGSEASSENFQREVQDHHHELSMSTKRSYDCTFCKRGFTNSRALGGHMNIHRKERTNAMKAAAATPKTETTATPFVPEASTSSRYCCILEAQSNYEVYLRPSSPETNHINNPQHAYTFQYEFLKPRNQEILGANLSLQIDQDGDDDVEVRRRIQEDDIGVDLELRLGHDSYSNF